MLFALALAAQVVTPEPYRAVGASPLWDARIGEGIMVFETPDRDILRVEMPPREETELGFAHSTPDFSISVEHASCTDPLTRRVFADKVTVRVGDTHFEGCGGRALSPALPAYSAAGGEPFWWVEIYDGRLAFQMDERVDIVPVPALRSARNGSLRVYEARGLSLAIRRQNCDLEDDRTYADTVTVRARGRTVVGCGGVVLREAPGD